MATNEGSTSRRRFMAACGVIAGAAALPAAAGPGPNATAIQAAARTWYVGLVGTVLSEFRGQLESGEFRPFSDEDAAACDHHEVDDIPAWRFEGVLEERFIRDDSTAHLVLLATEQSYCAAPGDPCNEAAQCLAADVFAAHERGRVKP